MARNVVEQAFGRLKARFRSLRKQIDMDVLYAPNLITACCCLHNFCEENNEKFLMEWDEEARVDADAFMRSVRERRDKLREEAFCIFDGQIDTELANTVRDAVRDWLDM